MGSDPLPKKESDSLARCEPLMKDQPGRSCAALIAVAHTTVATSSTANHTRRVRAGPPPAGPP